MKDKEARKLITEKIAEIFSFYGIKKDVNEAISRSDVKKLKKKRITLGVLFNFYINRVGISGLVPDKNIGGSITKTH